MLYRGVNKRLDVKNEGRILPKGSKVEVVAELDGRWKLCGKILLGPSVVNTVRTHHIDTGLYDGSGISTSRSENKAMEFATHVPREGGGHDRVEGYVYIIDEGPLEEAGVMAYEIPNPKFPEEQEVTLIGKTGGSLPESVIVEKYAVDRNGNKIQSSS